MSTLLSLKNITKTYPGVLALNSVSLDFEPGEVHAIVGENGAGKSTLIKILAGAIAPDHGSIEIEGQQYPHMTPTLAIDHGISVIYQEFNLIDGLSAAENLFLGERANGKALVDFPWMNAEARQIFARFGVEIDPEAMVATLTPAHMQIVEISKSIHRKAKVIVMDEPSAPLTLSEVEKLYQVIRELKAAGVTIIYISHRFDEIFAIADRVSVLRDGRYIATKPIGDTNRQDLISLMVGRELRSIYPKRTLPLGEVLLEVRHLTGNGVRDISFSVRRGEILGFSGLVGAGRTELMSVIYGAERREGGQVLVLGSEVRVDSPRQALKLGIGLIPEDRKKHGVFLDNSILWNIGISTLEVLSRLGVVSRPRERAQADRFSESLRIRTPSIDQAVAHLSGGNQQKVALAKVLAAQTDILIFDEPTRGIDVGARQEIYQQMVALASEGKAILMVSSDMEELLGLSDRVLVLAEGRLTGEVRREDFTQDRILELASRPSHQGTAHA